MNLTNKVIQKTIIAPISLELAWWKWTTQEGLKTFFGADNKIELTLNGAFEIYFFMDAPVGFRGSEGCKVLSFLPQRYFSFSWNVPPQFEVLRASDYKTWVVVEFQAISDHQTEIIINHFGWLEDEVWIPVFDYFTNAWEMVVQNLSKN